MQSSTRPVHEAGKLRAFCHAITSRIATKPNDRIIVFLSSPARCEVFGRIASIIATTSILHEELTVEQQTSAILSRFNGTKILITTGYFGYFDSEFAINVDFPTSIHRYRHRVMGHRGDLLNFIGIFDLRGYLGFVASHVHGLLNSLGLEIYLD